jgi:hypothetical protein
MPRKVLLLTILLLTLGIPGRQSASPVASAATAYYVASYGTPGGDGSMDHPWDLATALAQPSAVQPGDTIWLRGGSYLGPFTSQLTGSAAQPIVVRAYPGERVTLDGGTAFASTLQVNGAYTWYWGFEVIRSDPDRVTGNSGSSPGDLSRGASNGVNVFGHHVRFINLVVHDDGQGFGFWRPAQDSEIYGSIVYNNGWLGPDRGHGHAIYTQNLEGTKRIADNILFNGFSYGIHAYTEGGYIQGFDIVGNVWFNNGILADGYDSLKDNCLVGGLQPAARVLLQENYGWAISSSERSVRLGYTDDFTNQEATLLDNYFVGETTFVQPWQSISMHRNTFFGAVLGVNTALYPNNTYLSSRPTDVRLVVRPNQYEAGRFHIIVYNWDLLPSISLDLGGLVPNGTTYKLLNAQNYYGLPVLQGVYDGTSLQIPMTGLRVATPYGYAYTPPPTGPEFNVFVLVTGLPLSGPPAIYFPLFFNGQ